jgi:hypothetical protein
MLCSSRSSPRRAGVPHDPRDSIEDGAQGHGIKADVDIREDLLKGVDREFSNGVGQSTVLCEPDPVSLDFWETDAKK